MKRFKRFAFAAWLTIAAALLLGTQSLATSEKTAKSKPPEAAVDATQFVGSETYETCHETTFETSPHWKTTLKRGASVGCEACHGPGKEHLEGGGDKSKIFTFAGAPPDQASKRCMSCHQYGEEHANFDRSQHNINSVSCVACHSAHHPKVAQYLLVQKRPELCYSCHTEIKQDFSRRFRHRVDQDWCSAPTASYKPKPWLHVSGTVNVLESRDNVPEILHREHNRNYGFTTTLNPRPRFGFEVGYNYDDVYSTTNICYLLTATIPANSTCAAPEHLTARRCRCTPTK